MKSIYTYYKERLIEISGKNRNIYTRTFTKKTGYDVGRLLERNPVREQEFLEFLWSDSNASFTLISTSDRSLKKSLAASLDVKPSELPTDDDLTDEQREKIAQRDARRLNRAFNAAVEKEISALRAIKRDADDIEKETGRFELFIGYPFVYGGVKEYLFKAPLLLFPVQVDIENNKVNLRIKRRESIRLNLPLIFAYAGAAHIDTNELVTEFDSLKAFGLNDVNSLLNYLAEFGLKFKLPEHKHIHELNFFKEPEADRKPEIRHAAVLARYSLANSIYNDYSELEKKHITSMAAEELLNPRGGLPRLKFKKQDYYIINDLDYAQLNVVQRVAQSGNMVIYGPPGTGKSQTIVNLISDAICKGKRVLVVSQKKAALEVVYNRLGDLNERAMFVVDPIKERKDFYDRCLQRHTAAMQTAINDYSDTFRDIDNRIKEEVAKLETLSHSLQVKSSFGMSLIDMYYSSFIPGKRSGEYMLYKKLLRDKRIMSLDFNAMSSAISALRDNGKAHIFYTYATFRTQNPFIRYMKENLSIDTLSHARNKLNALADKLSSAFDEFEYPFAKQILAHYDKMFDDRGERLLVRLIAAYEHPKMYSFLQTSKVLFPLYPIARIAMNSCERKTAKQVRESLNAIDEYTEEYQFLKEVLTTDGYALAIEAVLNGDKATMSNLKEALDEYVKLNDIKAAVNNFKDSELYIAAFAYRTTKTKDEYLKALDKILPLRIYKEITEFEDKVKVDLSHAVEFESIRSTILSLQKEQREVCRNIFRQSFLPEYKNMYGKRSDSKDYLYQISKKQNYWTLRRTMEVFGDYLLTLFPCWLLSPENISSILPLKKNMFDLVLFDEASQVFIESTIPAIIRGKHIVVAGDAKQLRPSATFLRRYMGNSESDDDENLTRQAALEVESLLDLAVARYESANITYHYRSASRELIDFSNKAFYDDRLKIAPNSSKSVRNKPIERIKVEGRWINRRNEEEALAIANLIKKIIRTRKNGETIGVITFNSEQQACIEDTLETVAKEDENFRAELTRELSRKEDGQDIGLFIKNIENVQGDERDIIIFSIGYAPGENGKIYSHFGSLSTDGGENRLNVAITRAKRKIYVVTSIEPEELKVETSKNNGPKLFKQYLAYVRAVSTGKKQEVAAILESLCPTKQVKKFITKEPPEYGIARRLQELGYTTEVNIGEGKNRISVAVYDKKSDKYTLGIQLDQTLFEGGEPPLERDIYSTRFLEQKGWKIMRVWSRDWWHNADEVIKSIVKNLST